MKIRTDFVTNSSSVSYGEVVIDNPVLLEILTRYKEEGLLREDANLAIGAYLDSEEYDIEFEPDPKLHSKTPALHYFLNLEGYIETLEECLSELIRVMDQESRYQFNEELYRELREELKERENEINESYNAVYWDFGESNYGSACPNNDGVASRCWHFSYDKVNGESYEYEQDGEDEDFNVENW